MFTPIRYTPLIVGVEVTTATGIPPAAVAVAVGIGVPDVAVAVGVAVRVTVAVGESLSPWRLMWKMDLWSASQSAPALNKLGLLR